MNAHAIDIEYFVHFDIPLEYILVIQIEERERSSSRPGRKRKNEKQVLYIPHNLIPRPKEVCRLIFSDLI